MAEKTLDGIRKFLAQINDANSFLYQAKAIQLFVAGDGPNMDAGLAKVKAKLLVLPAQTDLSVFLHKPTYRFSPNIRKRRLSIFDSLASLLNTMRSPVMAVTSTGYTT